MPRDPDSQANYFSYFVVIVVMFVLCFAYVLKTMCTKHICFALGDSDPFKVHPEVIQVHTLDPSDASKQACTK